MNKYILSWYLIVLKMDEQGGFEILAFILHIRQKLSLVALLI